MQVCAYIGIRDSDPETPDVYHKGAEARGAITVPLIKSHGLTVR